VKWYKRIPSVQTSFFWDRPHHGRLSFKFQFCQFQLRGAQRYAYLSGTGKLKGTDRKLTKSGTRTCLVQMIKWKHQFQNSKIHEILISKREDRFSNPFFELVQNTCQVCFSYLRCCSNLCKGPRTLQKFPQTCQKIAGCWGRAVYVRKLRSPRHLAHLLRNDRVWTIPRVNHGLTQRATVTPVQVLCLVFFNKKSVTKRK
jgi:hypothetical protein